MFGLQKTIWKVLDYGIHFQDINVVEKVFVDCYMLHNNILSEMESKESDNRVGCGEPFPGDDIWIQGG